MCTLVVATRVWEQTPLVVAANRDEQLTRPAAPPHHWARDDGPTIFAPRDLKAGGTWLGLRGAELFVALTNRYTGMAPAPGPRSRGELVVDALSHDDVESAAQAIAQDDPGRHAPFHLCVADRDRAHLVWNDGERLHHEVLPPGIHVVSERSLGAAPTERDPLLHRRLASWPQGENPSVEAWAERLREHAEPTMEGPCVHLASHDYGTRSSTIVRLHRAPPTAEFWYADGRPCTTDFEDLSDRV